LIWWSLVFGSSGEGASGSWTAKLLADWFGLSGNALEVTNFLVRKAGHIFYYGILASLIAWSVFGFIFACRLRSIAAAGLLALGTGVFDEVRQSQFDSRTGTPIDLIYDSTGIVLAVIAFLRVTRGK
jgi:VanZ family protein